ncbi:LysR substrate-binding domain-containing protein [Colwelliaceae bacterium BS250]
MSVNLRKVDLNLLNVFAELIQDPHLTNTAKRLNMTQPAVSMALQRLRSLYNDSLFVREGRTMKPTVKALEIAPTIIDALSLIKSTLPDSQKFNPLTSKINFRMNIFNYAEPILAVDFVEQLQIASPNSALFISSEYIIDPEKLLRDRRTDIHVDYKSIVHPDFNYQEISRDHLVVIARIDHPRLKDKSTITMADLIEEKHAIVISPDGSEFLPVNAIKNHSEITQNRQIGYRSSSALGVLSMISKSDMITLAPQHLLKSLNEFSDFLQFPPPFPCNEIVTYINWYVGVQHEPSHRWFKEFMIKISKDY